MWEHDPGPIDPRPIPRAPREDRHPLGPVRPLRDDPIVTNAKGGSQSVIAESFTTMPLRALQALAQLQRLGDQKYGPHNWRNIPEVDHIDHAFAHLLGYCQNDVTEDHLLHAAWRLLAALEQQLTHREELVDE